VNSIGPSVEAAKSVTGHGDKFVLPPLARRDYRMSGS